MISHNTFEIALLLRPKRRLKVLLQIENNKKICAYKSVMRFAAFSRYTRSA
jgi:hypothetical protein